MRKFMHIALLFALPLMGLTQTIGEDLRSWRNNKLPDTTRLHALNRVVKAYLYTKQDSAELLTDEGLALSKEIEHNGFQITFLMKRGSLYYQRGNIPKSALAFQTAIRIGEKTNDQLTIAKNLSNMAVMYRLLGKKEEAMRANRRALSIAEKLQDEEQIATCLNNIGIIYASNHKYEEALKVYERALEIRDRRKEPAAIVNILGNLALIYEQNGNKIKTDSVYNAILGLMDQVQDPTVAIAFYNARADIMNFRGKPRESEGLAKEALRRARIIKDEYAVAKALVNLSEGYAARGMNKTAIIYADSALSLSRRTGSIEEQKNALVTLSKAHEGLSNYSKALSYLEQSKVFTDSMVNSANNRAILQMQYAMEFDQKAAADSVLHAQAQQVKDAELEAIVEKNKTQKQSLYILGMGIGLALLFGLLLWRRFHVTNRQQKVIQQQTEEIEQQRLVLEVKNKELVSSVEYAKRLQEAILPAATVINQHFKDSFCLYLPKELVAGDFYWMEVVGEQLFFACGGGNQTGVPGAMYSVMTANALSKLVTEMNASDPEEIVKRVLELTPQTDNAGGQNSASLSVFTMNVHSLDTKWAGHNAQLWVMPKHESSFTEYITSRDEEVQSKTVQIDKGDKIYLFSDGYKTIFNNEQMRIALHNNKDKPMQDQLNALDRELKRHLNKKQLADDITVIGLTI